MGCSNTFVGNWWAPFNQKCYKYNSSIIRVSRMVKKKENFPKGFSLISGRNSGSYSSVEDEGGNLLEIGKDLSEEETIGLLKQIKEQKKRDKLNRKKKFWKKIKNKIGLKK